MAIRLTLQFITSLVESVKTKTLRCDDEKLRPKWAALGECTSWCCYVVCLSSRPTERRAPPPDAECVGLKKSLIAEGLDSAGSLRLTKEY